MSFPGTICAMCYASFEARTSYGICPNCYSRDRLREFDRLESTFKSIRRKGIPMTLTLIEWLSIISDFHGKCAYCEVQPYNHIEMVNAARGLVRDNVVPCCRSCLVHKQNGFHAAEERIRAYLDSEPRIYTLDEIVVDEYEVVV